MKLIENNKNNYIKKYICIEGNIGSGKSTFIKKLLESLNYPIVYEPTDKWQNINGINILDNFYKDPQRWAYSFQSYAFLTRINAIENEMENENKLFFAERSIFADRYAFAKACYNLNYINNLEWNMYCNWHQWMTEQHTIIPSGFIYLKVDTEISYSRIKKRARYEEESISLDYLNLLNNYHEEWLINKKDLYNKLLEIPILILDCNKDFEYNEENWDLLLKNVNDFIINKIFFDDLNDNYFKKNIYNSNLNKNKFGEL